MTPLAWTLATIDATTWPTFTVKRSSKPIVIDRWHVEHPGKMNLARKLDRLIEAAQGIARRPGCLLTGKQRTRRLWRKRGRR